MRFGRRTMRTSDVNDSRGFTVVEVVVVLTVIVLLMALLLPALVQIHASSRRLRCANNLRQISLGIISRTDAYQHYPSASTWGLNGDGMPVPYWNWVVESLPWIDRRDLGDQWNYTVSHKEGSNPLLAASHIPVIVCPSDVTVSGKGDLSYAVNGGIGENICRMDEGCTVDSLGNRLYLRGISYGNRSSANSIREADILIKLGLMYTGGNARAGGLRVSDVADGLSNTMMLSENVRVGVDPFSANTNWSSSDLLRSRIFFSHRICPNNICLRPTMDYSQANAAGHAINAGRSAPEGRSPWLSSYHDGGVNMAFADGHVDFVSELIDGEILVDLFTSQRCRLKGTAFE